MIVISSTELHDNVEKYLNLTRAEQVIIQRGETETFVLSSEQHLESDNDLSRAITVEELLEGVEGHIRKLYRQGKK